MTQSTGVGMVVKTLSAVLTNPTGMCRGRRSVYVKTTVSETLVSNAARSDGTISHVTTPENPTTVDQNTHRTRWRCNPFALTKVVVSTTIITASAIINAG